MIFISFTISLEINYTYTFNRGYFTRPNQDDQILGRFWPKIFTPKNLNIGTWPKNIILHFIYMSLDEIGNNEQGKS